MRNCFQRHQYTLIKLVRQGESQQYYLVKHIIDNQFYIIRQIKTISLGDAQIQMMLKQMQIFQNLCHQNILKVKQSFYDSVYGLNIVMQYAQGGDFTKKIKQQKNEFSQQKITSWLYNLCLGLKYLHQKNILHGNICPKNIFISKEGTVKLGNFGVTKIYNNQLKKFNGNLSYIAPQVIKDKNYTLKADIWSLGACIYQICSQRYPFKTKKFVQLKLKTLRGVVPINHKFSKKFRDLVYEMLDIIPQKRPFIDELLKKPLFNNYHFGTQKIASFRQNREINLQKLSNLKKKLLRNNRKSTIRNELAIQNKKNNIKWIESPKNYQNFNGPITPQYKKYTRTNRLDSLTNRKNLYTPRIKKVLKSLSTVTPKTNQKSKDPIKKNTKNLSIINKRQQSSLNQDKGSRKVLTSKKRRTSEKQQRNRCLSSQTYHQNSNKKHNFLNIEIISIESQDENIQSKIGTITSLIEDKLGKEQFQKVSKIVQEDLGFCSEAQQLRGLLSLWYGLKIQNDLRYQ